MGKDRKPEWTPDHAGTEFASRVRAAKAPTVKISDQPRRRSSFPSSDVLFEGIRSGDRTLLAKAITLIESNSAHHFESAQSLLKHLLPLSGNSIRIGITGVPGAGKSTFIENFGLYLIEQEHKVAVLAIDPSSSLSKGSILGDKTRMEGLSRAPGSFIRPSPSGGNLGGVARKTRETIIACEAAGYDIILIETLGVGQSEITVRSMVDFFLLMQISGAGDELQGIKNGIMELADLIVVNKADGDNLHAAELACRELNNALHYLRPATPHWQTKAQPCSALHKTGLGEIWTVIQAFIAQSKENGVLTERRCLQNSQWFDSLLTEAVLKQFYSDSEVRATLPDLRNRVEKGEIPVLFAVQKLTRSQD